jgi:hypothetical protein
METERWFSLVGRPRVHPDRIEADAVIPDDSPFFDGHFPERPVVPGIAILALVDRTLREAPGLRRPVTGFKRVKFRKLGGSGGSFSIAIWSRSRSHHQSPDQTAELGSSRPSGALRDAAELPFEVTSGGEAVSDGLVILRHEWSDP